MTNSRFYAHSLQNRSETDWEDLEQHLHEVASLAMEFAAAFDAGEWGRLAGLWHDLGKFRPEFQARLRGSGESVEHAGLGAALARYKDKSAGIPLAFAIAGHHAGLANLASSEEGGRRPLIERLAQNAKILSGLLAALPPDLIGETIPPLPDHLRDSRSLELWTRFLFSCLVDADYLATESFYSPGARAVVGEGIDSIAVLRQRLDDSLDRLVESLPEERRGSLVNRRRAEVLAACRTKAELSPGVFSLTVPTGGGKTLSAMAFALRHAEKNGLRRVVVAIPYTSIIEQNAAVYRAALGPANVLEHHSGIDPITAEERDREAETRRRLAAENWDAPVVVTTNVQLFESLFAASPSRCRKLHNLAGSVLLLDEAQTLPVGYLLPVLEVLRDLVASYRCTVVLTTATQPALARRDSLPAGLDRVHEIMPDPAALARDLARVEPVWPEPGAGPVPYEDLARELADHECVLAIVHRRKDARRLAERLPDEGRFHLSALMCPAHRSERLAEITARLKQEGAVCRLVSTQLIEAGVDVDFPVVYRCLGGLDSLAQAAGRCNREGRLPGKGRVVFFRAETPPPAGLPDRGLQITASLLLESRARGEELRLDDTDNYEAFFRRLYFESELDAHGIQALRKGLCFESVARKVRLIDSGAVPVIVPWGAAEERLESIRRQGPDRFRLRALQPFVVNLFPWSVSKLQNAGALEEVADGILALSPVFHGLYDPRFGLLLDDDEPQPDPARLIV
ncbi:MAG TPA: CRISPR-associated endonuclease Cas3'' [Thermoanaerobaculia bacterium]|nr:CRISPR-associated endonuclease Cas3'' [Thermoanaerobaculia bacterium]